MSRILGLSGLKSLEQFKYVSGSNSEAVKAKIPSVSSHSVSSGSFSNLKLTAEKLVKEQASAKTDLELANSKLKKLTEQIQIVEDKLQASFNENAKLKVKQKEDDKLWRGLESKFSLTKTLCDQLTETLQQLAIQVQDAENDKTYFEVKLSDTSIAIGKLHDQMKSMSWKLESSEEMVKTREQELMELGFIKEQLEKSFRDDMSKTTEQIMEKDAKIKQLEEADTANKMTLMSLNSEFEKLQVELGVKEEGLLELKNSKEKLVKDNTELLSSKKDIAHRLETTVMECNNLENFVNVMVVRITELENQSLGYSEKIIQLDTLFGSFFELVKQEKELGAQCALRKFNTILDESKSVKSEKNAVQLANQELNKKFVELQKEQEFAMVQHAEDCRLAEEKIRKLEAEAEFLISKQTEMLALIAKLEDAVKISLENSRASDEEMKALTLKLSEVENQSNNRISVFKGNIQKKQEEVDRLQKEVEKSEENLELFEKRFSDLGNALKEKEHLILELKTRENQFEDQTTELRSSLADAENKLEEAKKQYDQMLESKQLELSKHLKDISQRNDQAINDIRRKFEVEKLETVDFEKQKADKIIKEMEKQMEEKMAENSEASREYLRREQEEHAMLISHIEQEYNKKEMGLVSKHIEELRRTQLQSETELREKTMSLKAEHEAQIRALRCEHEDECRALQEELDILKGKEERQRTLLQLQWKVMGDNPPEEQEVNSKKTRKSGSSKRNQHDLYRTEGGEEESPYLKESQTPVSNLLKKVNPGSVMSIPKHKGKVTHHEYEIETSNGRTITKRRKTKSTIMFGDPGKHGKKGTPRIRTPKNDPGKHGKKGTPRVRTPRNITKEVKSGGHPNPSTIGDLFSEGSLNPYADDPYAFD